MGKVPKVRQQDKEIHFNLHNGDEVKLNLLTRTW